MRRKIQPSSLIPLWEGRVEAAMVLGSSGVHRAADESRGWSARDVGGYSG